MHADLDSNQPAAVQTEPHNQAGCFVTRGIQKAINSAAIKAKRAAEQEGRRGPKALPGASPLPQQSGDERGWKG